MVLLGLNVPLISLVHSLYLALCTSLYHYQDLFDDLERDLLLINNLYGFVITLWVPWLSGYSVGLLTQRYRIQVPTTAWES